MNKLSTALIAVVLSCLMISASAQDTKVYKEGYVTQVTFVRTKPGKFDDYMKFLDTSYKPLLEAQKKAGLVIAYGVYGATPRTPQDPDLILTVTFANMAVLDRTDEFDAVSAKLIGPTSTQNKGAIDRESIREILGSELDRELILK
jgi:hypothetical protein